MSDPVPILVTLDRPRAVSWSKRARVLNSSLARPVSFEDLADRRRCLYALCAILWAGLEERDPLFAAPEDLADHLATEEQQLAGLRVVRQMIDDAFPQDKKKGRS